MEIKISKDSDLPHHHLVQTTFHFVPISKTLESLFAQPIFVDAYIKHNEDHVCTPGVYKYFCCGENHKKYDIYRDPYLVQIQIGYDDFELCNPLKTKTGQHKQSAVYFRIKNFPWNQTSKEKIIFLVALAKTVDLKNDDASFDNISKVILKDLQSLELDGFEVTGQSGLPRFKAALTDFCYDNLGGSTVCGMQVCFIVENYCRICECTKR